MDNQTELQTSSEEPEITLRCNKCNRPITPAEAVLTPTGYRCKDCVRNQQRVFDTSKPLDYVWAFLAAAIISFVGSLVGSFLGFYVFLLAPAVGVAVAEVVRLITRKRRSSKLFNVVTAAMIVGAAPLFVINIVDLSLSMTYDVFSLFNLLPLGYQVLYLVLAVPSAYYRLSGRRRP